MSETNFPTFRLAGRLLSRLFTNRLFRWLFSWRIIRRVLITLAVLITIVALAWTEENVRGKWAWNGYKSQLEAKGEKLALKDFVPPQVPEDQNFAMTPMLAGLYDLSKNPRPWTDTNVRNRATIMIESSRSNQIPSGPSWNKSERVDLNAWASFFRGQSRSALSLSRPDAAAEVLRGLTRFQSQMDELHSASRRPFSRFNIAYDTADPMEIFLPHLAMLKSDALVFQVRASAEIALANAPEAISDVKTELYLANAVKNEPFEISYMLRISIVELALESIWEGLSEHKWSDEQLVEFQARLGQFNLLADFANVLRADRAWCIATIEFLRTESVGGLRFMPSGWFNQNKLTLATIITERFLPAVDPAAHRIWPEKIPTEDTLRQEAGRFFPHRGLALMLLGMPEGEKGPAKFASCQTRINEAIIACALERYRLKNGQYPDTLDALKPEFIDAVPNDIVNGKPLIYRRTADGRFLLYSVGWNLKDDGGVAGTSIGDDGKNHYYLKEGDWVWPEYPTD